MAQTDAVLSGDQPGRIRIVAVKLPISWDGKTKLGLMIVHPHIVMRMDKAAFSMEEASKQKLRQTIMDCLSLVTNGDGKGCEAQVVVFPEFAVPSGRYEPTLSVIHRRLSPSSPKRVHANDGS